MASSPTVTPIPTRLPSDVLASATAAQASAAIHTTSGADSQNGNSSSSPVTSAETSVAIGELVEALKTTTIGLRFEIDETTHRVITKVVDKETGELIRQMPTEEVLRVARAIDKLQGLFVSQTV